MNTIILTILIFGSGQDVAPPESKSKPPVAVPEKNANTGKEAAPQPDSPAKPPMATPKSRTELRKEARDKVLLAVGGGAEALSFLKRYGDHAVFALEVCTPETGKRLVGLFVSGDLSKLKSPQAALTAVCQGGEPAGVFLIEHIEELEDPFRLACWVKEPWEYIYQLKDLEEEAARLRAARRSVAAMAGARRSPWSGVYIAIGVLVAVGAAMYLWNRRSA